MYLLVLVVAAFGALLSAPDRVITPDYLPTYDILVLAVVVAGSLLTPAAAFYVAVINSVLIAVDFLVLQPHSVDLTAEINLDGLGLLLGKADWLRDRSRGGGLLVGKRYNERCSARRPC